MQGILLSALLVLCQLITNAGKITVAACIASERDALLAFKAGFSDPAGGELLAWSRVSCGKNKIGPVVSLDIGHYDLTFSGEINSSLAALTRLVHLNLSGNDFGGATNMLPLLKVLRLNDAFLPATDLNALSHTNFTALRVLELSCSLPRNLGNLTSLSFIQLRANNLEGEIPGSMSRLCNLCHIDLSGNHFSGDITRVANTLFPCMNQLKILDLALNNLTGGNMINGELPKSLKHMKALELLDMSSNQLEGCIPDLPSSVKVLDLSGNHLYGPLPQSLGAKEIYYLSLKENFLSRSITYLCEMVWMEQVLLSLNNFSGVLPNCWRKDSALRVIDFSNNNIHGEISSTMGSLTSLGSLLLHRNKLSGPLPTSLKLCNRLIFLDLSENNLSGTIPTWIGDSLQSLILLSLRSNNFSGEIPELLSQLHALQILDIADNNLSGPVPKSLGNLAAMQLGRHMIQQQFSTISDIHFMVYGAGGAVLYRLYAYLYLNSLLAGKLQYNGTAFYIDLSGNQLAGEIPIEIGFLSGLTGLNLSGNHIRGSIPEEFGNLRSLEVLDLSRNDLSGPIPQSFLSLSGLSHLNLSYSDLSGAIPFGNELATFAESTYFGNANLCGPPLSRSCLYHRRKHQLKFDTGTYLSALLGFAFGFCIMFVILIPYMVA
uniref:non-specific serine/threonine protein kinase n=1 Tax=Oryza punctata TaxID=4537 RepID=A0A0E0L7K2_ORYPU